MRRAVFAFWVAIALAPIVVTHARADSGKRPSPETVRAAQNHMQRARTLYEAGNYPDAIAELETARALDPYAKDLVFNLGIVHEKALHFEDALRFYRLYLDMDLEPAERAKAESIIKRLEGARVHVQPTATATATVTAAPITTKIIITNGSPPHGRIDGLTVGSFLLALAGYGVGAGFGVSALATRPPAGSVTGSPNDPNATITYADLKAKVDAANTLAIIADIGFASGIVFSAITLGLFFGRTKNAESHPWVSVIPGPGSLSIGGRF